MSYLVLAYPELSNEDFNLIQDYRKVHDIFYPVVHPHFTIVFPVDNQPEKAFIREVEKQSGSIKKIEFLIKCATINKDAFSDYYHIFLVPDQGFSDIVKLHDKLYSGLLFDNLRLDIDFIPHIGIGNSKDKWECKKMVDRWNSKNFSIKGQITHLTMVNYENDKVTSLKKIKLK